MAGFLVVRLLLLLLIVVVIVVIVIGLVLGRVVPVGLAVALFCWLMVMRSNKLRAEVYREVNSGQCIFSRR